MAVPSEEQAMRFHSSVEKSQLNGVALSDANELECIDVVDCKPIHKNDLPAQTSRRGVHYEESDESVDEDIAFDINYDNDFACKASRVFCSQASFSTRATFNDVADIDLGCSETEEIEVLENAKKLEECQEAEPFSLENESDIELGCDESFESEQESCGVQHKTVMKSDSASKSLEDDIKNWAENVTVAKGVEDDHSDFFKCVGDNEIHYPLDPNYMTEKQPEMSQAMRAILIDWMVEVCADFHLKRDTLHIAINYLDRYLSLVPNVPTWKVQLVGISSLFAAAKIEVNRSPLLPLTNSH